jgi:hypothetical protein
MSHSTKVAMAMRTPRVSRPRSAVTHPPLVVVARAMIASTRGATLGRPIAAECHTRHRAPGPSPGCRSTVELRHQLILRPHL